MPSRASTSGRKKKGSDGRIPWGTLSRAQIVEAATEVVRRGDYEQMTIRSLAAELGAAPMSLYRHVRDRDDLLDEVVDRLLAGAWRPGVPEADSTKWLVEACDRLRSLLVAEPAALHVFLRHPVVSPAAIERMEAVMRVLRTAGLPEKDARQVYAAIHTYTLGFAALEASRSRWDASENEAGELALQLAAYVTPRQFREGLRYVLDGARQRVTGD